MDSPPLHEGAKEGREPAKLQLRSVIQEVIRTRYCPEHVLLLVDRVAAISVEGTAEGGHAFRLWLSDGVKCIQGVLGEGRRHSRLHKAQRSSNLNYILSSPQRQFEKDLMWR